MENKAKKMIFAALFAALTAAVAQFKIPLGFTPVPITLQTLMVLLSGAMLGSYYGALAMLLYIAVGALGLPVFAGGSSGIGVLMGPTGGYLFSYFIAAFVVGKMAEKRDLNVFLKYLSFIAVLGLVAIVSVDSAFKIGIIPFLLTISYEIRLLLIIVSVILFLSMVFLMFYAKRVKYFSLDTALAMFAGTLIIYLFGSIQGKIVTGLPWRSIFVGWILPFIVGDTIKLLLAAYIAKSVDLKRYVK